MSDHDLYVGQVDSHGKPNGRGKLIASENSTLFEGYWKNGKLHGKGRFIDSQGNSYEGEWKNGLFDGKGVV